MASRKRQSPEAGAPDEAVFEQLRAYNELLAQADIEVSTAKTRVAELEAQLAELEKALPSKKKGKGASAEPAARPAGGVAGEALEAATARAAEAEAQSEEYLTALKRVAADFDNYKKRQVREREVIVQEANKRLVLELLPVLDDLERALEAFASHGPDSVQEGVLLVHRALRTTLEREGVSPIDPQGERFDPQEHEALLSQPSDDVAEGTVLQVVQRGFRLGDRVVRPARVVVSAGGKA